MFKRVVLQLWGISVGVLFFVQAQAVAQPAHFTKELFKRGDKAFVQQEGFYQVVIPYGFNCEEQARKLTCRSAKEDRALLQIEIRDVPKSGTVALVALNYERNFKKKPHYKLLNKSKIEIQKTPAIIHSMRYDYLGNVQAPVGVQALYLLRETKLFLIHFECGQSYFADYVPALNKLYGTFRPAQLDKGGHPIIPQAKSTTKGSEGVRVPKNLKPFLNGKKF
jgi:hypothetical protein